MKQVLEDEGVEGSVTCAGVSFFGLKVQPQCRFRRSASLAILYRTSFAAIPSVSRVHLGHTNRNVSVSNRSTKRELSLV